MPRRSGFPQGSERCWRGIGDRNPLSLSNRPREEPIKSTHTMWYSLWKKAKQTTKAQRSYLTGRKNRKNPEKTCKKGLTSGEECGILSELQESGTARSAKAGRTKKLEKSLKNLLTNERQSGIINKLRAARQCSEKHSSLKIEQQDSCILMTKVQRLRKFF